MLVYQFFKGIYRVAGLLVLASGFMILGIVFEAKFTISRGRNIPLLSQAVDLVIGKSLSEGELIRVERETRKITNAIDFSMPIWWRIKPRVDQDSTQAGWYVDNTVSGFLVLFRERIFYLSVGHREFTAKPEDLEYGLFHDGKLAVRANNSFFSEIMDVGVISFPLEIGSLIQPAEFSEDLSKLKVFRTPLFITCNKLIHRLFVRTGFFHGISPLILNQPDFIIVGFPGVGAQPGCSGAPIIGLDRKVKGMITRQEIGSSGILAYGISSLTLIKIIIEQFFN